MKKIINVLLALAVFAGSLIMTGCGLKDAIDQTHNKWYKYNKEGGLNIPLGATDDEDSADGSYLENAEFYVYFNSEKGLKTAVQSKKTEAIELYGGAVSTNVELVVGGTKEYTKEQFGAIKWTALISSGYFTLSEEPKVSSNPDQCVLLTGTDDKPVIQWKKVLKRYLINLLFGEDVV